MCIDRDILLWPLPPSFPNADEKDRIFGAGFHQFFLKNGCFSVILLILASVSLFTHKRRKTGRWMCEREFLAMRSGLPHLQENEKNA